MLIPKELGGVNTERVGLGIEEAEQILTDDNLFLTNPGSRYGFEAEEAAKVWAEAQKKLDHLAEAASDGGIFGNTGVSMLLWNADRVPQSFVSVARSA